MRLLGGIMLSSVLAAGCADVSSSPEDSPAPTVDTAAVGQATHALEVGQPARRVPARIVAALRAGAIRIAELQADRIGDSARNGLVDDDPDDGGWDFTLPLDQGKHGTAVSPENLYGATALGVYAAARAGAGSTRFDTVLLGTGLGAQERPEIDSPSDFTFLTLLGELADDPAFSEIARTRYDARKVALGSARAIGERTRDARHAANADGLIPYDLALWHLGAAALEAAYPGQGYERDAVAFAQVAVDDLRSAAPFFEIGNPNDSYYVQGLAWTFLLLDRAAVLPRVKNEVRQRLLDLQKESGAWGWNGTITADNAQATAHAVEALSLSTADGAAIRRVANRGASWLIDAQQPSGGWAYTSTLESPLLDGEALLAIYLSSSAGRNDTLVPSDEVATSSAALKIAGALAETPALAAPLTD